jgi:hypothetical protein
VSRSWLRSGTVDPMASVATWRFALCLASSNQAWPALESARRRRSGLVTDIGNDICKLSAEQTRLGRGDPRYFKSCDAGHRLTDLLLPHSSPVEDEFLAFARFGAVV